MNWHDRFLQQAIWTRDLRAYLFGCAGISHAGHILEAGCGTGAVLCDMETPASLHAIDINQSRLLEARQHVPLAMLACADAACLPYPSGTFDITFCHFLLLWVPDPLQVLNEMKRVTRKGGSVLALAEPDYTTRVDEPASLVPLGTWQTDALRRQGADPSLGARLGELFLQAGIPPVESGCLRAEERGAPDVVEREMEWAVIETDLGGYIPSDTLLELKALDKQAWDRGERVLFVPTYFAYGVV